MVYYLGVIIMDILQKLEILSGAAKYDASCSSSGSDRGNTYGGIGNALPAGCCHSFSADGRCISLLKVLLTNYCICDCKYCVNRSSNDVPRAGFTPEELADLTIGFYKRNYIEGLFLSSGIVKNADYTMELMLSAIKILRYTHHFNGYIHVKTIPGASPNLVEALGMLVDRMSVNIELPSETSLKLLCPQKDKESITKPMSYIKNRIIQGKNELTLYKNAPKFVPAGQSTQMIIGATPDTDFQIMRLTEGLYNKYTLKRVYYSAYIPVGNDANLPAITAPPLLREHRLYQADWLLRFYKFKADELIDEKRPFFSQQIDPKCDWALRHLELFPIDVNFADYETLLRIPGIGVTSARRIISARRTTTLDFPDLKKLGIVLKRAQFFVICKGKYLHSFKQSESFIFENLASQKGMQPVLSQYEQLSLLPNNNSILA